jgi:hypothetical protein
MDPFPETPEALVDLSTSSADRLLDRLEAAVPRRPPLVEIARAPGARALVFGDSHGDWRSTGELVETFRAGGPSAVLLGLGDYIDRAPADCGPGSVVNALWLLSLEARWPERVYLLTGNHELARRLGAEPHTLPGECEKLWADRGARYARIMALLERGPVAASTGNGAYLAHAGFPRGELPRPWTRAFEAPTDEELLDLTWAECAASRLRRGAAEPWDEEALARFRAASGVSIVLRGHDPDLTGRSVYSDRVLTLHTCRLYERYGGVIAAWLPLDTPVTNTSELTIVHLPTEGRTFPSMEGRR